MRLVFWSTEEKKKGGKKEIFDLPSPFPNLLISSDRSFVIVPAVCFEACFGERFGGGVIYFYAAGTSGADGALVYFFEAFFWLFGGR